MDELYEDRPCGITGLTYDGFKQISSDADVVRFRESAMVGGEPNVLAMLASDQCRNGITLRLPDGSVERITGTVLSQAERAAEVVNRYNPKLVVEGTKSAVHRFPRKFTSKEMSAPASLNRRIISMPVLRHCGLSASVIPLVWKQRVDEKRESLKSSKDMLLIEEFFLS